MSIVSTADDEELAALLAQLPPAPEDWVAAAQQLPLARRALDTLVARAETDAAYRAAVLADLERALEEAGLSAGPEMRASLRVRLAD